MSVQTFRKKPVEVQAAQFTGTKESANQILAWLGSNGADAKRAHSTKPDLGLIISTLEGDMHVTPGDFVIRGVQCEFYPCKPDIFEATYEPAGHAKENDPELKHLCTYHDLMRSLAYYTTGVYQPLTRQCGNPPTHYVAVAVQAGDFDGEEYNNLCPAHEVEVRQVPGWRWSRPKQATA